MLLFIDYLGFAVQAEIDEQHMNNYRRLFPRPYLDQAMAEEGDKLDPNHATYLTERDLMLCEWYRHRCLLDKEKCSQYK